MEIEKNNEAKVQDGIDAFGQPIEKEGEDKPTPIEEKKVEGEGKEKEGEGKGSEESEAIQTLRSDIETIRKEYGENLAGQRKVIKSLEKQLGDAKKGGEGEGAEPLHKDIKWSKDLSEDERDEMTDTEIKQMDEIAQMKEAQNKMFADMNKKGEGKEGEGDEDDDVKDLNNLVKETAGGLVTDDDGSVDKEIANQIIENVKKFNLDGLSQQEVKQRVAEAAKLVEDYKPPKEQKNKKGKPVKSGKNNNDPYGVDDIVEQATKGNSAGDYQL